MGTTMLIRIDSIKWHDSIKSLIKENSIENYFTSNKFVISIRLRVVVYIARECQSSVESEA